MNGFTMLQQLPQKNFALIFTTAYNQYAINAIRHSAIDYLVKPVRMERLLKAVNKAENYLKLLQKDREEPETASVENDYVFINSL